MDLRKKQCVDLLKKRGFDSDPVKAWAAKMRTERGIHIQTAEAAESAESQSGHDFDYILNMPIFSFTREKKEALLRERDDLNQMYKNLAAKTPMDLWTQDQSRKIARKVIQSGTYKPATHDFWCNFAHF